MNINNILKGAGVVVITLSLSACSSSKLVQRKENKTVPATFQNSTDTLNTATVKWRDYFTDPYLIALIDTALKNNQELNITLQEVQIARNEIRARKGEYLPFIGLRGEAGTEKSGRYTSKGSSEANTDIKPGTATPDPLQNYLFGANASWELDIWGKLHNAKRAAVKRYVATEEGKNFVITNLIAEIANEYYELLALDNQLDIVKQNIVIQNNALLVVKMQKEATRVTELAVRRFEAQVLNTRSLQYDIQQKITVVENRINFLLARYPQPIPRDFQLFNNMEPNDVYAGIPAQLLANRPDVKQAEQELAAAKLDVKVARARFYPSLSISAGVGVEAFNPSYVFQTPASLMYNLLGELTAPLINRNAIKATYYNANAKQIQAVYNYERTILKAYLEVANQLSNISNLKQSFDLKAQEVVTLTQSTAIADNLFKSARADYMEVLLTQRDMLESKFDLIETRKQQMNAMVDVYHALGGGWN